MADDEQVSERQKKFEDGCRVIANELFAQLNWLPMRDQLLAKANLTDLFGCIRASYTNGRADERGDR